MTDFETKIANEITGRNLSRDDGITDEVDIRKPDFEMLGVMQSKYRSLIPIFFNYRQVWGITTKSRDFAFALNTMTANREKFTNWTDESVEFLKSQFELYGEKLQAFDATKSKERWERLAEQILKNGKVDKIFADKVYEYATAVNPALEGIKMKNLLEILHGTADIKFKEDKTGDAKLRIHSGRTTDYGRDYCGNIYTTGKNYETAYTYPTGYTSYQKLDVNTAGTLETSLEKIGRDAKVNLLTGESLNHSTIKKASDEDLEIAAEGLDTFTKVAKYISDGLYEGNNNTENEEEYDEYDEYEYDEGETAKEEEEKWVEDPSQLKLNI